MASPKHIFALMFCSVTDAPADRASKASACGAYCGGASASQPANNRATIVTILRYLSGRFHGSIGLGCGPSFHVQR